MCKMVFLLGQFCVLHDVVCDELPAQAAPLYFGAGLEHDRDRVFCPPPQDLLHVPYEAHEAQFPLTTKITEFRVP